MKFIKRWSLMKSVNEENIAEHSAQVAHIAHALALIKNKFYGGNINADRVATLALYHESSEVITGDLPTPIKYYNPKIRTAYKEIEGAANQKLISMLPEELREDYIPIVEHDPNSYEYKLVKVADKISAYVKCVEELKSGNREFAKAEMALKADIDACLDMPEVEYFCANFLEAFSLTLDELD